MTHAPDVAPTFDDIWPREAAPFLDLLNAGSLPGAEAEHAVTVFGVVLARAFLAVVDAQASADDLRALLAIASSDPLDLCFSRRLVAAVLDETRDLPGVTAAATAQIDVVKEKHRGDTTTPADWRAPRKAVLALADQVPGSVDAKALEITGGLAWPLRTAARSVGDILGLLCTTRADIAVVEAGMEIIDRETILALVRPLADEQDAAEAAGAPQRSLNDIFDERYPALSKRVNEQSSLQSAARRRVGTRLLRACLRP